MDQIIHIDTKEFRKYCSFFDCHNDSRFPRYRN